MAVLTPYKAQMRKLRSTFALSVPPAQLATIDFATVDGFQARSSLVSLQVSLKPSPFTQGPHTRRVSAVLCDLHSPSACLNSGRGSAS